MLLAGTNDMLKKTPQVIYEKMESKLKNFSKTRSVCITTIPPRFDLQHDSPIHDEIAMANNYIREIVSRLDNVYIIDFDSFNRLHFTRHGLHLNYRGKKKLSFMIIDFLNKIDTANIRLTPITSFPLSPISARSSIIPTMENKEPITVIEANIMDVFEKHQGDEHVAFSHCISADLNNERSMSAGIATIFKEKFGKPSMKDCITSHLAYQKTAEGAEIFSLITKDKYYQKPKISNYNLAFEDLTREFKKRGLKQLICSPMGCTRDGIEPEHFVAELIKFIKVSKASVYIVTCNEYAKRKLRNGLSYSAFVEKLRYTISSHRELWEKADMSPAAIPISSDGLASTILTHPATPSEMTALLSSADEMSSSVTSDGETMEPATLDDNTDAHFTPTVSSGNICNKCAGDDMVSCVSCATGSLNSTPINIDFLGVRPIEINYA
ncbi:hypothetical protein J6590_045708 [Homalodisca vitripennis]|nr:hypothetical protein J6590_045708 [Homalodisca vitripennis]